jgi:xylulokinase
MLVDLTVGIDVGTSSTKAVAVATDGTIVASRVVLHQVDNPRPGWFQQDAEAVWWEEAAAVLRQLMADPSVHGRPVRGLAVSGMGPCVVLADAESRPLGPGILYGIDARAEHEIAELTAELGSAAILARTGSALSSQSVGPKLLWLRRNDPDAWQRARGWFGPASLLVRRLTGRYVLDRHTASQCQPLYDLDCADWAADWAAAVCGDLPMPELAWSDEVAGVVTSAASDATGLPTGTPVLTGTVDAWAEAHSVGVRAAGDLMLMYGSTMFLVGVTDRTQRHPGLWLTNGLVAGSHTLAAGLATSGLLTDWVARTSGEDIATLSLEAAAVLPGAEGLVLLPYFAGERSPLFDPGARGVLLGLELRHRPAHLLRAAYEGIAMGVRHNLELFGPPGDHEQASWRAVAVGGGTSARTWTQVVSDVTGLAQQVPAVTIGAAYGDALLAARAVGAVDRGTDWTRVSHVVEPDPELGGFYDHRYAVYRRLYEATRPLLTQIARYEVPRESAPT